MKISAVLSTLVVAGLVSAAPPANRGTSLQLGVFDPWTYC